MDQRSAVDALLKARQDLVDGVHYHVHAENVEDGFVFGVADQRHGAGHLENALGHLADYQVGVVASRHSDQHIGPGYAGVPQGPLTGAVALYGDYSQFVGQKLAAVAALFHHDHLVA